MYDDFIFTMYSEKRKSSAEQGGFKPHSSGVVFYSIILSFLLKVPDFCLFETQIHTYSLTLTHMTSNSFCVNSRIHHNDSLE